MCKLWKDYYLSLAEEIQDLTKFDMVFKQQIDQLVYAIDNNFNPTFNSKILLSHEEIQHHIKSLSKGKHLIQIFSRTNILFLWQ